MRGGNTLPGMVLRRVQAFYDRKRKEGKRHTQALIALTRRGVDIVIEIPPYLYIVLDNRLIIDNIRFVDVN